MATTAATPVVNGADRRRSGRVVHAPSNFSQEPYNSGLVDSAKRKRSANATNADEDEDEPEVEGDVESESEDEDEGEPDEEERREKRRKQRTRQPVAKPAAKRAKTGAGASTTLAIRSANAPGKNVSKAAKQKARSRPSQIQASGLYADVFGKGLDAETAATSWHNKMESDHVAGITEMINFVLQVVGCDARITSDDIQDVDNVPDRLTDVLEQYAEQKEGDYSLSGKQKQYHGMKEVFSEFFKAIPHALHNSGLLYEEVAIYDNLHVWIATMSGAPYRSFRVTSTIASLALTTGQTEIATELRSSISATKHQLDAEKKKKNANKGRVAKLQEEMSKEEKKLELIDTQLKDAFDTVYVHRYRDVEEKLRVECAAAMGSWILNYRSMFLEGQYLRYLGWVMSDPHPPTRLEVIRQLKAMYKIRNNLSALRGFTDKFRPRMVEMGARDADTTVRVEAVELLNMLRGAEMLEPDDIDIIGQLIFDNEPQVRKAVAQFFVSNIQDLYGASIEDFDKEEFDAALPEVDKIEDFDEPCKLWIKFKCLAQTLGAQTKDLTSTGSRKLDVSGVEHLDSRYMVATQSIFDFMPDLQEWESLAGYLLHDHSSITTKGSADISLAVQEAYKLESGEEIILLDVLFCAARLFIMTPPDNKQNQKGGKSNKAKDEFRKRQETAAHNLSAFIPQLHSKFGSVPRAAKSILRLNQLFNPDLVNEIEDEDDEINALLDDVSKEFTSHSDPEVLAEATRALRAALGRESSRETANRKVNEMWRDLLLYNLSPLLADSDMGSRGTLDREKSRQLADVTMRLAQLASVKDCCEVIEGKFPWVARKSTRKRNDAVQAVMLQLIKRGVPVENTLSQVEELEDQVCKSAVKILLFYYRWKTVEVKNAIAINDATALSTNALTNLATQKNDFVEALLPVITSRKPLDSVRIAAILSVLDLHVLLATLRNFKPNKGTMDDDVQSNIESLVTDVNVTIMAAIMETHEKMEKRLAQRTHRKNVVFPLQKANRAKRRSRGDSENPALNGNNHEDDEGIERPPEDSDDEDVAGEKSGDSDDQSSDDGDAMDSAPGDGTTAKDLRKKASLVAETSLCELTAKIVLAILAAVVPNGREIKARLQVNRTKLGKSYTQVIAYSDDKKEKNKPKSKGGNPKTPVKFSDKGKTVTIQKPVPISEPMVLSDDDIDEDDNEDVREDDNDSNNQDGEDTAAEVPPEDNGGSDDEIMGD